MSIGKIVASIEIIVSVWGALELAKSLGTFRWDHVIAKALFYFAVILRVGIGISNLQWSKFSDIGLALFTLYLLLVILFFYHTDILKTIIAYSLYWFSIMTFQLTYLFVICYVYSIMLSEYINDILGIIYPYYGLHILGLCIEIAGVCLLIRFIKNRKILSHCGAWFYIGGMTIIACELRIEHYLLNRDMALEEIDKYIMLLALFLIWALISISGIMVVGYKYIEAKYQQNKMDINMKLLREQYGWIVQSYEDKRYQIHDFMQHDIMLLGLLTDQQYEKAVTYLRGRLQSSEKEGTRYTGLSTVDIMLNHKVLNAKRYGIRFYIVADVYHCPLKDDDLCVLMGNLLDNSIDAVKDLPEERRWIEISFQSPNKIFIMEILNPYAGGRRKKQGHYLTTKKEDRQMHGIGLQSVEKIVSDYGGDMEITDSAHVFKVVITVF